MIALISREALIKELNELWRYVPFPSSKDVFDIIMKAKAIAQGEAVAWYREMPMEYACNCNEHINEKGEAVYIDFRMSTPPATKGWIPLYTAPSVAQGEPILLNNMSNSPEHVKAYIKQQMPDLSKELVALMTKPNIDEIQTLRAKVEVLVGALDSAQEFVDSVHVGEWSGSYSRNEINLIIQEALAPYDKLSEVKHD